MKRFATLAVLSLSLATFVGCNTEDDPTGESESDVVEGGSCAYSGEGNDLYKQAVAQAKRYQTETCEVLQYEIAELAQRAVDVCPAVGSLIASSEWAGALREALGPLQVAHLAGYMKSKQGGLDAGEAQLAIDAGQTFWSPAIGAYGSWKITHFAGGTYETETLIVDENDDIVRAVTDIGTYTVLAGEAGSLVLRITPEKEPIEDFALELYTDEWSPVEMFRISPIEGSVDPDNRSDQLFSIHLGECDA